MQPKHDVILVCSNLNQYFAEELGKALNNAEVKVVLALDNASPTSISDARLMLLVASSPTLRATTTQSAIGSARQAGIPIVAGRIDSNPKSRPESLGDAIWVDDKRDQSPENLAAIVATVQTKLAELQAEQDAATSAHTESEKSNSVDSSASQYDVFISYSRKDKSFANELYMMLVNAELHVWMDRSDIHSELWEPKIQRGLRDSHTVIVVISPASLMSPNVQDELARASSLNKPFIPVKIFEVDEDAPRPMRLDRFNWIDATYDRSPAKLREILEATKLVLAEITGGVFTSAVSSRFPFKKGVRPPDTPATKAANEALSVALNAKSPKKAKLVFQAINDGANDVFTVGLGRTALDWAISKNEIEIAKLILERGGEFNATSKNETSPLHTAAAHNTPEIAAELLAYGANVDALDLYENTPLHIAAEKGSLEVVRVLLDAGANLSAQDFTKDSPLHKAVGSDNVDVAALLIARGANMEAVNEERETPLHSTAYSGVNATRCANLLLSHGANREALNNKRATPLAIALEGDTTDIIHLFRTGEIATMGKAPKPSQTVVNSDVFISHAAQDKVLAEVIYQELKRQNYDCWMAPHSVLASENRVDAARRGVGESRALVLLKSADSEDSSQVMSELQLANELQLPMFWLELDRAKKPILDQFGLRSHSYMEMTDAGKSAIDINNEEEMGSIFDLIKQFLAVHAGVVPEGEDGEFSDMQIEIANQQLHKAMRSRKATKYDAMIEALRNGADDYDASDSDGNTVLHWAIQQDDVVNLKALLSIGADIDAENNKGETPRSLIEAIGAE